MTYISFNVKEARNQLLTCGYVYTLRAWDGYPDICLAIYREGKNLIKIGTVKVTKIASIFNRLDMEMLDELPSHYINGSGFKSLDDWWHVANRIHKEKVMTLYLVEKK